MIRLACCEPHGMRVVFDLTLAPRTLQSLRHALEHNAGKRLSKERLGNEFDQVFGGTHSVKGFRTFK